MSLPRRDSRDDPPGPKILVGEHDLEIDSPLSTAPPSPNPVASTSSSARKPEGRKSQGNPPKRPRLTTKTTLDAASGGSASVTRPSPTGEEQGELGQNTASDYKNFLREITPVPELPDRLKGRSLKRWLQYFSDATFKESPALIRQAMQIGDRVAGVAIKRAKDMNIDQHTMLTAVMAGQELNDEETFMNLVDNVSSLEKDLTPGSVDEKLLADFYGNTGKDLDKALEDAGLVRKEDDSPLPLPQWIFIHDNPKDLETDDASNLLNHQMSLSMNAMNAMMQVSLRREKFLIGRSIVLEQKLALQKLEFNGLIADTNKFNKILTEELAKAIDSRIDSAKERIIDEVNNSHQRVDDLLEKIDPTMDVDGMGIKTTSGPTSTEVNAVMKTLELMNSKIETLTRKIEMIPDTRVIHAPLPTPPRPRIPTPQTPRPKSVTFASDEELDYSNDPITPNLPPTNLPPTSSGTTLKGVGFFLNELEHLDDKYIVWWAKVISWGDWGALNEHRVATKVANGADIHLKRSFIKHSIYRAFEPNACCRFLLPPLKSPGRTRTQSTQSYGWGNAVYRGEGPLPSTGKSLVRYTSHPSPPKSTTKTYTTITSNHR